VYIYICIYIYIYILNVVFHEMYKKCTIKVWCLLKLNLPGNLHVLFPYKLLSGARNIFWWWNIRAVGHFVVERRVSAQQWSSRPRVKYMQGSSNKHKDIKHRSMKCSRSWVLERVCVLRAPIIVFVRRWALIENERYFVGCWMTLDRFLNLTCLFWQWVQSVW